MLYTSSKPADRGGNTIYRPRELMLSSYWFRGFESSSGPYDAM
jgi:hypothetical protein